MDSPDQVLAKKLLLSSLGVGMDFPKFAHFRS